ncbi:hypothetical protein [Photobacterium profundum]|uniref:hypothetical protein n=1 Tax=Photobacterium profundum TaxID=74109 RepID=UPI003D0DF2B5
MTLEQLIDSDLLEVTQEFSNLYIEMVFLTDIGEMVKIFASNNDTSPISIKFIGLNISAKKRTLNNTPTLGEVEGISLVEGDFGLIQVTSDRVSVEAVL